MIEHELLRIQDGPQYIFERLLLIVNFIHERKHYFRFAGKTIHFRQGRRRAVGMVRPLRLSGCTVSINKRKGRIMKQSCFRFLFTLVVVGNLPVPSLRADALPDTKPLEEKGDLAALMVEGIGKYLDRELAASVEKRKQYWKFDLSSPEAYAKSVQPNRERLKKILGVVDERVKFTDIEYVGGPKTPSLVADTDLYKVYAIRWPVLPGVDGEGLLLEPKGKVVAQVIAIPDADWTPEQIVGLAPGVPKESQYARRLAEFGWRVVVPVLIDRKDDFSQNAKLNKRTNQPHREFIYRMSYEMGRHIIGYELQKIFAVVDWFKQDDEHRFIGILGYGEGGLLALDAAAIDSRIKVTSVSGYFKPREELWKEPIYRNVWELLTEFGDAELLLLASSPYPVGSVRCVSIDPANEPAVKGPPTSPKGRSGAAPGELATPKPAMVRTEFERSAKLVLQMDPDHKYLDIRSFCRTLLGHLKSEPFVDGHIGMPTGGAKERGTEPKDLRQSFNPDARQKRQFDQLVAFTQKLWRDSEPIRAARFAKCDYSSPEKYEASIEPIRQFFDEEIIGKLPAPTLPMNPKSREVYDTPKWKGYEVTLDLYPDVFAEGILLLPKDLKPNEKRPVVVCQHGLEGRPQDVCNPKEKTQYYNSFGAQLAELGYIVYAPQNPYIGKDLFRVLQRKANPLKLSCFRLSSASTSGRSIGCVLCPMWMATRSPSMGLAMAARRRCACRPSSRNIACPSAPATSTNGSARTFRSRSTAVICGRASTRCSNSIWAIRSTTRRWPTSSRRGRSWSNAATTTASAPTRWSHTNTPRYAIYTRTS